MQESYQAYNIFIKTKLRQRLSFFTQNGHVIKRRPSNILELKPKIRSETYLKNGTVFR